jgi:hypothetical protein
VLSYHSECPEYRIVYQEPGLLSEPSQVSFGLDSSFRCKWHQNVIHNRRAKASENNNVEGHHPRIVPSRTVFTRLWVEVGKFEEFAGMSSSSGKGHMCQGEKHEEIDSQS